MGPINLTVIIPAFNEQDAIEQTLNDLMPFASKNNWKIIVVNDGSIDQTKDFIEKIKDIKVINHPYNKGYGASLKSGIKAADTPYIAFYDADGQHRPTDLQGMYDNLSDYDMLIGKRSSSSHQNWIRKPGKWVLSKVANTLSQRKIPDLNSGLRIIKRDFILKMLPLFPDGFSFSTTSTIAFFNFGYQVGYYPIITNKRIGKSTVKQLKHGSQTIMLILRLIILFNPLRIFLPVSTFLFSIGLIYEIIYGFILSDHIRVLSGSILAMISALLIFFFGLIAEQISELRKNMIQMDKNINNI